MLKRILKSIPGVKWLYRFLINSITNIKSLVNQKQKLIISYIKGYNKKNIIRIVQKWNFDNQLSKLENLAKHNIKDFEDLTHQYINENKFNSKAYALMYACLSNNSTKITKADIENLSLEVGNELVYTGRLKEACLFFVDLEKLFPEIFESYKMLYEIIYLKQEEYRTAKVPTIPKGKKSFILSFTLWGDQYVNLFTDYCLPSMLSEGNLPAVSNVRDILVDIYAQKEDILKIQKHCVFNTLITFCEVNFIEFPSELISSNEYKKSNAAFRYLIYGGFHHLSIERARSIDADAMCIGPDNLHADGSFLNYINFIDTGYEVVLCTGTRAQAEFLKPVLDKMKNFTKNTLSITSEELVNFSTQYIHHSFFQYIVVNKTTPIWRSGFFLPNKNGFTIRSFHYHPVILSSQAIHRDKKISWNYRALDNQLMTQLFPNEEDWKSVKVITESSEGIMLDLAYGSLETHKLEASIPDTDLTMDYLDKISENFNKNEHWNFQFEVKYDLHEPIKNVKTYLYNENNELEPVKFPLNKEIKIINTVIDDWYNKK